MARRALFAAYAHAVQLWGRLWWAPATLFTAYCGLMAATGNLRGEHFVVWVVGNVVSYATPRTKHFAVHFAPFVAIALVYDLSRFALPWFVTPNRVLGCELATADRWLAGGGHTLQQWLSANHEPVLDLVLAAPYFLQAYLAVAYAIYLYFVDTPRMRHYAVAFGVGNLLAMICWFAFPAAPPWYVAEHGCQIDLATTPSAAGLLRLDELLGISYFRDYYSRNPNAFAALPSMHNAFPVFGMLTAWRSVTWKTRPLHLAYFVSMAVASMYFDHHWFVDAIAGWAVAFVGVLVARHVLGRLPPKRSADGEAENRTAAPTGQTSRSGTWLSRRSYLTAIAVFGLSALGFAWPSRSEPKPGVAATPPYLTFFLIDGLDQSVFQKLLGAGRLPNIQALSDAGVYVENGIASFPSMTGYGFYPFLTGHDAAQSGVLGLRWLDRERSAEPLRSYVGSTHGLLNGDWRAIPKTVFERAGDAHSFSLNSYANRGVKVDDKGGYAYTMAKYRDRWWPARLFRSLPLVGSTLAPTWEDAESELMERLIDDLPNQPKVQWFTLASLDAYQHVAGTDERYEDLVVTLDALIGKYRAASRALGQEADRVYAVITDHGVTNVAQNLDLRRLLRNCCGLNAMREQATHLIGQGPKYSLDSLAEHDALVVINGDTLNFLYLAGAAGDGFSKRLTEGQLRHYPRPKTKSVGRIDVDDEVDLIAELSKLSGIELLIGVDDSGNTRLFARDGEATILRRGNDLGYRIDGGSDPLGYAAHARAAELMGGGFHSPNVWLEATLDTNFPDALYRVSQLMASPNVGDLVITAALGFDLGAEYELIVDNYRGGHGGLRADQLRVPYVLSGSGLARGLRIEHARAEDIGATLLQALGYSPDPAATGRVLDRALVSENQDD